MSERPDRRLLVVDGDPELRQSIAHAVAGRRGVCVVATAMGCRTGLPKIESYKPDIVLIDLVNDRVEGFELLQLLRRGGNGVVCVGLVPADDGGTRAAQAQGLGARTFVRPVANDAMAVAAVVDAVCADAGHRAPAALRLEVHEPSSAARTEGTSAYAVDSVRALRAVMPAGGEEPSGPAGRGAAAATVRTRRPAPAAIEVVGIGISTGGPKALGVMLPMLPADLPVPVLIVQHMPPLFTASLAESLSRTCKLPVREARAGENVVPGQILIAPGGKHMRVVRVDGHVAVRITEDPPENSCRPAVDYLFRSLAEVYGPATCAVMMTGMGEDGFAGCRQLHALGAPILAQDEGSCTVYGMPRGPVESGIADAVVPLDRLAGRISEFVRGERRCN